MAENSRSRPFNGKGAVNVRYFYLDSGDESLLHKSLHVNRSADQITTWCYPLAKRIVYTYSDIKKRRMPAFTTQEVSKMLNRDRVNVERAILSGSIEAPQFTYKLDENRRKYQYLWSEKDVIRAHEHFLTVHRGRPRHDGRITPQALPTLRELRAMMRQEQILYVKNHDGEFVPAWRAPNFD